jgi:hypothetical protein
MFNFKNSFAAFAGVCLFVCSLAALLSPTRGQVNNPGGPPFAPRTFYMTNTNHDGSQALFACTSGYHMASLWEIFDPSNLKYNRELGFTYADSGSGPPSDRFAWIRTGGPIVPTAEVGKNNCKGWMSHDEDVYGTLIKLSPIWAIDSPNMNTISPWEAFTSTCNSERQVWCLQD